MKRYQPLYIKKYISSERAFEKIKKTLQDDEIFESCLSSVFMTEAVIKVDDYLRLVKKRIDLLYSRYKNKYNDVKEILELLNFTFNSFDFNFTLYNANIEENDPLHSGIFEGGTRLNKTNEIAPITFYCTEYIKNILLDLDSFDRFKVAFLQLAEHEVIHRGQILRIKNLDMRRRVATKDKELSKTNYDYYKLTKEIMAYAKLIIEEFRFSKYEDNNILSAINQKEEEVSPIFDNYLDLYKGKDESVLHTLYKYIYMYIKG